MANEDNKLQIISYLHNQTTWVTTTDLSSFLNISVRNIKYCIADINKQYDQLISSSNKGYKINHDKAAQILNSYEKLAIPRNYEERKSYIINTLLLEKQRLSISELSDQLCISPVTLQNELSKIRTELSKFHLNIHTRNDIVTITGLAKDKRSIILSLINDEIKHSYFSIERIQQYFTNVDLKKVEKLILMVLNRYEYFLDNYSLLNYVLHIALTIEIRSNNMPFPDVNRFDTSKMIEFTSPHVIQIVNDLYNELKLLYNTDYTLEDIYQASILMMTHVVSNQLETISYSQLGAMVGNDIIQLLEKITASVNTTYCIDLNDEDFLVRFSFHLKNLLIRLVHQIPITCLQFNSIKNDYPLIYAISVHISDVIYHATNHVLPEDEIAYIALHIGVLMEANKAASERVSCLIVCPDYNIIGKNIFKKLSAMFSDKMLIRNIVTAIREDTDLSKIDLILTTEILEASIVIRQYMIEPFLSEANIRTIFDIIEDIKSNKKKNIIRQKIMYFFHEDLFFAGESFENDTDAIERICDTMIDKQYVEDNYKDEIYAHEKISPSSYGNTAIPHPLDNNAKSSVIAISINPNPIHWGFNEVNIVFMLSLMEDDRELFSDIFEFITQLMKDDAIFKKIMSIQTFDEFINLLVSLY